MLILRKMMRTHHTIASHRRHTKKVLECYHWMQFSYANWMERELVEWCRSGENCKCILWISWIKCYSAYCIVLFNGEFASRAILHSNLLHVGLLLHHTAPKNSSHFALKKPLPTRWPPCPLLKLSYFQVITTSADDLIFWLYPEHNEGDM